MRIENIQILRAIAALNVVIFHSIEASRSYGMPASWFSFMEGWGRNGVDLFFVISGFVMVFIQRKKDRSPLVFFRDRMIRIIPVYWLYTLLMAGLLLVLPSLFRQMTFSGSWLATSLAFLSGFVFSKSPVLYLGWTIELEMFFYLIFTVALFFRKKWKPELLAGLILTFGILLLGVNPIVLEFVFGMGIAWIFMEWGIAAQLGSFLMIAGVVLFLGSLFWKDSGVVGVLMYGVPSTFMVTGAIGIRQSRKGILSILGDASYGIYLVQVFTVPVVYKVAKSMPVLSGCPHLVVLGSVFFTSLAGWVGYRYLEVPLTMRVRTWFDRAPMDIRQIANR